MCQAHFEGSVLILTGGRVPDRAVLRLDLGSRRRIGERIDDDPVVWSEARPDDPQTTAYIADLDPLRHDGPVRRDGHHEMSGLVRSTAESGTNSVGAGCHGKPYSGEFAGRKQQIRIGNGGSGVDRAARPVEHIVYEVELALL